MNLTCTICCHVSSKFNCSPHDATSGCPTRYRTATLRPGGRMVPPASSIARRAVSWPTWIATVVRCTRRPRAWSSRRCTSPLARRPGQRREKFEPSQSSGPTAPRVPNPGSSRSPVVSVEPTGRRLARVSPAGRRWRTLYSGPPESASDKELGAAAPSSGQRCCVQCVPARCGDRGDPVRRRWPTPRRAMRPAPAPAR